MADKLDILLVDDSRAALLQLARMIEEIDGAQVVGTASSGAEAVRSVAECRPQLVLMDIVMPEMDGLAALRLLRARDPELRVAMVSSAGGSEQRAAEAFRLGAIQVVGKPADREVIEALVASERERRDGDAP